ncbi:MAG TPA: hypothetical protein VE196_01820 [Pseudonocardiaceae bacterium]|jgi:hypothetical protein|nr:hypothetical protein [Pseudonocardiaceae bacterium]
MDNLESIVLAFDGMMVARGISGVVPRSTPGRAGGFLDGGIDAVEEVGRGDS